MTEILLARFTAATRDQTLAELLHAKGHPYSAAVKGRNRKTLSAGRRYAPRPVGHTHPPRQATLFIYGCGRRSGLRHRCRNMARNSVRYSLSRKCQITRGCRHPASLQKLGADPATLLWVIKEAALKASGEVMTDPRHLAVKRAGNAFTVEPSVSASSPVPAAKICLFDLPSSASHPRVLLAAAQVDIERKVIGSKGQISLKALNLQVISINLT